MLNRKVHSALARGEKVGAPSMIVGQMTLGWQRGSSFVTRLLAKRALWAWRDGEAVRTEWTES